MSWAHGRAVSGRHAGGQSADRPVFRWLVCFFRSARKPDIPHTRPRDEVALWDRCLSKMQVTPVVRELRQNISERLHDWQSSNTVAHLTEQLSSFLASPSLDEMKSLLNASQAAAPLNDLSPELVQQWRAALLTSFGCIRPEDCMSKASQGAAYLTQFWRLMLDGEVAAIAVVTPVRKITQTWLGVVSGMIELGKIHKDLVSASKQEPTSVNAGADAATLVDTALTALLSVGHKLSSKLDSPSWGAFVASSNEALLALHAPLRKCAHTAYAAVLDKLIQAVENLQAVNKGAADGASWTDGFDPNTDMVDHFRATLDRVEPKSIIVKTSSVKQAPLCDQ